MAKTTKRQRSDSAAGQQSIASDAFKGPLEPPACVQISPEERPFWDIIVKGKARRSWTGQDLVMAADLARVNFQIEKYSAELREEPPVVAGAMGGMVVNPKQKVVDTLVKRARLISAYLQIHPEATQGKARDQRDQNETHQNAQDYAEGKGGDDGLIPGLQKH